MSLDKLKEELERALERLGGEAEDAGSPRGSQRDGSLSPYSTLASQSPRPTRQMQLPVRTLRQHPGTAGPGSRCFSGPDGVSCHPENEDGDLLSVAEGSTQSPSTSSPHMSSEASDLPSCTSTRGPGYITPPPPSKGYNTPFSEGGYLVWKYEDYPAGRPEDVLSDLNLGSSTTLATSSTLSSLADASDCGLHSEASYSSQLAELGAKFQSSEMERQQPEHFSVEKDSKYGWALGATLQPCRGDLPGLDELPQSCGMLQSAASSGSLSGPGWSSEQQLLTQRRSVLADLVGCLYRIDESDPWAMRASAPLFPAVRRDDC